MKDNEFVIIPAALLRNSTLTDSLKLTLAYLKYRGAIEYTISATDISNNIGCSIQTAQRNIEWCAKHSILIPNGTKTVLLRSCKSREYTVYRIDNSALTSKMAVSPTDFQNGSQQNIDVSLTSKMAVSNCPDFQNGSYNEKKSTSTSDNVLVTAKMESGVGNTSIGSDLTLWKELENSFMASSTITYPSIPESEWSTIPQDTNAFGVLTFVINAWHDLPSMTEECFNLRKVKLQSKAIELMDNGLGNVPYIKSAVKDVEGEVGIVATSRTAKVPVMAN
jgi:hypothetical protein